MAVAARLISSRKETTMTTGPSEKSWVTTLLLCLFFGIFGFHRFYLHKRGTGAIMLFTLGGVGIWSLIDLLIILFGGMKDKEGKSVI